MESERRKVAGGVFVRLSSLTKMNIDARAACNPRTHQTCRF
jgi:hypothetical protein